MIECGLALIFTLIVHFARYRFGIVLSDEGFLWNGTLRIAQGDVPIRDYKSYDPGRFYWSWAWMKVFGQGLYGLRRAVAVFQFLGIWAGLTAIATVTDSPLALAVVAVLLALWMVPQHKIFDNSFSLFHVLAFTWLFQSPSSTTAILVGAATGLGGVFGRNHAAYGIAASGMSFLLLLTKCAMDDPLVLAMFWVLGLIIGYGPLLIMFATVRGMARSYWHTKIMVFFHRRSVNLAKSAPWPWRQNNKGLPLLDRASHLAIGWYFVALPLFLLVAILWAFLSDQGLNTPALAAGSVVGLMYFHHATSRSDAPHLCQVMAPFLVAIAAAIFASRGPVVETLLIGILGLTGWLVVRRVDVSLQYLENPTRFSEITVLGEKLTLPTPTAKIVDNVVDLIETHVPPTDKIFLAPMSAAFYPILRKQTPTFSDFLHFPETEANQSRIISDLETNGVDWALIQNFPLDKRDELMFEVTHPDVWAYLHSHFEQIEYKNLSQQWTFWHRRP